MPKKTVWARVGSVAGPASENGAACTRKSASVRTSTVSILGSLYRRQSVIRLRELWTHEGKLDERTSQPVMGLTITRMVDQQVVDEVDSKVRRTRNWAWSICFQIVDEYLVFAVRPTRWQHRRCSASFDLSLGQIEPCRNPVLLLGSVDCGVSSSGQLT
ncbi:hypothetical protein BDN72DRAFT_851400, partial [Pluteus cervinus]